MERVEIGHDQFLRFFFFFFFFFCKATTIITLIILSLLGVCIAKGRKKTHKKTTGVITRLADP